MKEFRNWIERRQRDIKELQEKSQKNHEYFNRNLEELEVVQKYIEWFEALETSPYA